MKATPEQRLERQRDSALILGGEPQQIIARAESLAQLGDEYGGRHFFDCLARSPRAGHLELLLQLVDASLNRWSPVFELAEGVAQRADVPEFVSLLSTRARSLEFSANLLQRLVCQGAALEHVAEVQVFRDELLEREHPFGVLPLRRTSLENSLVLSPKDLSTETRFEFPRSNPAQAVAPRVAAVVEAPDALRAATRAWRPWESLQVLLNPPHAGPIDLRSLPLASVRGGGLRVAETTASEVFVRLFDAAAQGGLPDLPFRRGRGALGSAAGRLAAFKTLSAFVDGPPLIDAIDVAARAEQCRWWLWEGTGWFGNVAWDFGAACLRPDGVTLVAHAATDTD
ncbi:MAG: hypothetical protein JNM69_40630 [Archangium sp.]|nr:hypothetical protein [Archangium sp.]